jgi:hypothetical protein
MNWPQCNFQFQYLVANGALPKIAPVVCENCAEISLLVSGQPRKMSAEEMESVKASPAWRVLEPAIVLIKRAKRARNAMNN